MKINPEMIKIMGNVSLILFVVTSLIMLAYSIFKKNKKDKRRSIASLFAYKIDNLFMETRKSVYTAWGRSGIESFFENGCLKPFMKKLSEIKGADRNHYIAYAVVAEYLDKTLLLNLELLTHFDFPEDLSIEKFLQKIKKRADDYTAAKIRAVNEGFIQAESFFGPQKIFLKKEKGNIYFIFLEDLNYYISFECQEILYHFLERRNDGKDISRHVPGYPVSFRFSEKEKKFVVEFESEGAEESFRFACSMASFDKAFDMALKMSILRNT